MRKIWQSIMLLLVIAVAGWFSLPLLATAPEIKLNSATGDINRGAYLARASGCIACHTDIRNGGATLAGGIPLVTEFGTFVAPNLTTDPEHGIGGWSLEQFAIALRHGISPQGEPYYPAFPYEFYTRLSDQDIADLWAAFQTVAPVSKPAPNHQLDFPFNIRRGLSLWQTLFLDESPFTLEPDRDQKYNRGKYLVESAAHCAACHSPRNLMGALEQSQLFHGAESTLEGESQIPAITAEALAEAGWSESDLSYALQTGVKLDGDVFGGSMAEVVRDGTGFLQKQDLDAIAYYLLNREG